MVIITYCYLVATAFFSLNPKSLLENCLGAKLTAKTNISSFDDPRGIVGSTAQVTFGNPISMDQIVFAALREPVAKRVVVDVAFATDLLHTVNSSKDLYNSSEKY